MKRALTLLTALIVLLGAAFSESQSADPNDAAMSAINAITAVLTSQNARSFDGEAPSELKHDAVRAYRLLFADEEFTDEEIYNRIFACGEYEPSDSPETELLNINVEIDSALDTYDGLVKVSVTVYADEGYGYEFYCMADVYLEKSYTDGIWRVNRLFFPE